MKNGKDRYDWKLLYTSNIQQSRNMNCKTVHRRISTYPDTVQAGTIEAHATPLKTDLSEDDIIEPAMLKLDIQCFELDDPRDY